jgi:UDP-N-acetylglucosamine--N-acetylmuramyl-(pentapeptide) pyrophosphoryl-undecaprenol N-acetylglucosamine transferase
MAGGTGGHVIPALTVARLLQDKGWEVHWLGTRSGLEATLVPKARIPLHYIFVKGLRRRGVFAWLFAPLQLLWALGQTLRILFKLKPKVVLGGGGFVSGPGGVAAWLMRCPLVIYEQNAIAGTTNRCLSRLASRVLEAFPGSFKANAKAICTGNPVRVELFHLPAPLERFKNRTGPLKLLILGGSRGAVALNQLCPKAILQIPTHRRPEVWHQVGAGQEDLVQQAYAVAGLIARVEPFIEDVATAYGWADLVLCRAGALTVSELAAVGVGSILVPFPFAVDDHQTYNGRFLAEQGAALLIAQSALSAEKLAQLLLELSEDRAQLLTMANAAYALARRDALMQVAAYCEGF